MKSDPAIRSGHGVISLSQHVLEWNQLHALGQQLVRHSVYVE